MNPETFSGGAMNITEDNGVFRFQVGQPSDLLPDVGDFVKATELVQKNQGNAALHYGRHRGDPKLVSQLSNLIRSHYNPVNGKQLHCDDDNILITAGSSQALVLCCNIFCAQKGAVFVEDPTYHYGLQTIQNLGLNTIPVPSDDNGLIPSKLEELIEEHPDVKLLYLVPHHSNPTTFSLAEERRFQLAEIAEKHKIYAVCDDVYQMLDFYPESKKAPVLMHSSPENKYILSINSFSKILSPGVRLGWIQAHKDTINHIEHTPFVTSSGGLNPYSGAVVGEYMAVGYLAQYMAQLVPRLRERAELFAELLAANLPTGVTFQRPKGGYFLWLKFPDAVDASELLKFTNAEDIMFNPGRVFSASGQYHQYARLCFAFYPPELLRKGVPKFCELVRNFLSRKNLL